MIWWFLFFPDGTDGFPAVTIFAVHRDNVGFEVNVQRDVRQLRTERRRPVDAGGTGIVETGAVPVTGGGKENAVAVSTSYLVSLDSSPDVIRCPFPRALGP